MRAPAEPGSRRTAPVLAAKTVLVVIVLLATAFAVAGCLGGGGSGGPSGCVEGVVSNSQSRHPLSGAAICFSRTGTSTTVYVHRDGHFRAELEPATWKMSVAKAGFEGKSLNVTVTSGATKTVNVALNAKPGTVTVHGNVKCESLFARPYPPAEKDLEVFVCIRGNESSEQDWSTRTQQ